MVFIPTYLYIKQHTKTGKLYFGKTIRDPISYKGSGKHWKTHIKLHGREHVVTLWYQLYDNVFDLVADALSMSESFNIVHSTSWLNIIKETGIDGGMIGYKQSKSHTEKIRLANTGRKATPETILLLSKSHKGQIPWNKSKTKTEKIKKDISGKNNHFYGKSHTIKSKELQSLAKIGKTPTHLIKKYHAITHYGIILCDLTLDEICKTFNLNKSSAYQYVNKDLKIKGYYIITANII